MVFLVPLTSSTTKRSPWPEASRPFRCGPLWLRSQPFGSCCWMPLRGRSSLCRSSGHGRSLKWLFIHAVLCGFSRVRVSKSSDAPVSDSAADSKPVLRSGRCARCFSWFFRMFWAWTGYKEGKGLQKLGVTSNGRAKASIGSQCGESLSCLSCYERS